MQCSHRFVISCAVLFGMTIAVEAQTSEPTKNQLSSVKEMRIEDEISKKDAKDANRPGSFCKSYPYKMEAGKFYRIDFVTRTDGLDPYLRLENPTGQIVGEDDDGGGFPNARG